MLTQGTADDKHDKNHRDLRAADVEREVERIVGLGRPCSTDHPMIEHRWRWHILADLQQRIALATFGAADSSLAVERGGEA